MRYVPSCFVASATLKPLLAAFILLSVSVSLVSAGDPQVGYQLLLEKEYLPPDFTEELFSEVWQVWPEPLRTQAEQASPLERRKMAFSRYGLTTRPGVDMHATDDPKFLPLQYVVNEQGQWTMNCFSCHGGQIQGEVVPGLPNSRYVLATLSEDLGNLKRTKYPGMPLVRMEKAVSIFPLGATRGTTNAVMFGVALMTLRDAELNVVPPRRIPRLVHHDMDAPAWWHFKKKSHLYADGYAERGHRGLMQFTLVRSNGPEKFRQWEEDFRHISSYLESIEAPKYPFPINAELAGKGRAVFEKNCAECHGTYGVSWTYPNRVVDIQEVGTDPVRYNAISAEARALYGKSWFGDFGKQETHSDSPGYVAPPLDGLWASAPYFHNGAVPTLWHVLHSEQRPAVWTRISETGYDQNRVGLVVEELESVPREANSAQDRREYFDTRQFGKSAAGHQFPDALREDDKQALLEYLKSL